MPADPLLIAFDLETTGLFPGDDRIVEIGAIAFDRRGGVAEAFQQLIHPGRPMPARASAINRLYDRDLADAPPAAEVLPDFLRFLERAGGPPLLAHNAAFDAGFLGMELARAGLAPPTAPIVDTLPIARVALPGLRSHRLDLLVEHFGLAPALTHRALADAEAVMKLWFRLGGPAHDIGALTSYPIRDGSKPVRPPNGWERLDEAAGRGLPVRIAYAGGRRGDAPRVVTPRCFAHRGGIAYLVATCHIDRIEKSFRLDRIKTYEIVEPEPTP